MPGRILPGLPGIARAAEVAADGGPGGAAVLITIESRLDEFADLAVLDCPVTVQPDLSSWVDRAPLVLITPRRALAPFPEDPDAYTLELAVGAERRFDELLERLILLGYVREDEAALAGTNRPVFGVRGDTLEIELAGGAFRVSFLGDTVERIERLGGEGDRPTEGPPRILIGPVAGYEDREDLPLGEWTTRLLEHLPGPVYLDAPELYAGEWDDASRWREAKLWELLAGREVISFGRTPLALAEAETPWEPLPYYRGRLSEFKTAAKGWLKQGRAVSIAVHHRRTLTYLAEKTLRDLNPRASERFEALPGTIELVPARFRGGAVHRQRGWVLVGEDLLFAFQGERRPRRLPGKRIAAAGALAEGDYLVHPEHGVGRFEGLETRVVLGVARDYVILKYAGDGRLLLPVEHLPLLRRHPGASDEAPPLSTLGTNEWARSKERARAAAEEVARSLIGAWAMRRIAPGVAYPPDREWDESIARTFPFQLTPDQEQAVEDTLADLERPHPMDRLVSGDVGFGKTEVAVRAAHRVVGHGRQVAVLVPTTVLARQHAQTFAARFEETGIEVRMLSRFTPEREARETLARLAAGSVDIVIGTHRLLGGGQEDAVRFKDLGLLVIDEEHRFGVLQKERIKMLKANVDVLALSATPIPRSLHLAMVGLRDVSVIQTPPEGRKPINTVLGPYDPLAVREAVLSELDRGGKAFYIHDRVASIAQRASYLQSLVPEARIGVAHGQMAEDALEEVMLGFLDGAYDLLVATTIVEAGLDVPEADTIIVERADRLGLAALYQLRGRVGRRERDAHAYLFYPGRLTPQAERRLWAISELNDLGSGHLLAQRDMEIRGAGNILGAEQHGHVAAVSLSVYTELLAEAVAGLKGEERRERPPVSIDLPVSARIPAAYIPDDSARIEYYGRLAEAGDLAELSRLTAEIRRQFGPPPREFEAVIELTRIRLIAPQKRVVSITDTLLGVQIAFESAAIDYDSREMKRLRFRVEATRYPPGLVVRKAGVDPQELASCVLQVLYLVA
jgi:transcription-repair coupling factor (superfamily II helicase)